MTFTEGNNRRYRSISGFIHNVSLYTALSRNVKNINSLYFLPEAEKDALVDRMVSYELSRFEKIKEKNQEYLASVNY